MVIHRIISDRYMQALKCGYSAEKQIYGVLRGGHVYHGYFYSVDKQGYFRVKIESDTVTRLGNHRSQMTLDL